MACLPPRRCVPSSPLTPHCHLISKKCSGPCVDPPLPPSLLTTYHLPLLPSILAAAFPFAICVLHFYTVFISCDALGGYASPSLSWPFFSSLSPVPSFSLSLSLFLSLFLSFSLSPPFSAPSHHSLYTWYLLCLAIAVKLAIVQLQRHGRLDVAPPHFVHLVHISVKLHLSFPPASIWWQFRLSLLAGAPLTMPLKAIAESIVAPAIFISWYLRVVPSSSGTH